jgi:hypothetical protein
MWYFLTVLVTCLFGARKLPAFRSKPLLRTSIPRDSLLQSRTMYLGSVLALLKLSSDAAIHAISGCCSAGWRMHGDLPK